MNDIKIREAGSGGDFSLLNSDLELTNTLTNQVYLALFGGNIRDDKGEQNFDYWANTILEDEQKYISTFEKTILQVSLNSSGLQKLKKAVETDLQYLKKYADISISLTIESKELLYLYIEIKAPNNVSEKIRLIWNNTTKEWQS